MSELRRWERSESCCEAAAADDEDEEPVRLKEGDDCMISFLGSSVSLVRRFSAYCPPFGAEAGEDENVVQITAQGSTERVTSGLSVMIAFGYRAAGFC